MIKQKRNLYIASVICVLLIIIMTITGLSTACSPPIDETNISTGSDDPTIRDYSFIGTAGVNMYTGKFGIMRVEPILDGLDILS